MLFFLVTPPTVQWNQIPGMVISIQSVLLIGNQNVPSQILSTVAHGHVTPCWSIQLNANLTYQKWSRSRMACPLRIWSIVTQAKLRDGINNHNLVRNQFKVQKSKLLNQSGCLFVNCGAQPTTRLLVTMLSSATWTLVSGLALCQLARPSVLLLTLLTTAARKVLKLRVYLMYL